MLRGSDRFPTFEKRWFALIRTNLIYHDRHVLLESRSSRSIITDVVEIAKYHSIHGGTNAGWFSIPRQVFCFVDFLGSIAYNSKKNEGLASTRKAVRFIKDFFPRHYKPYAGLLVALWRHGTVHHFTPSVYFAMNGRQKVIVEWTSNRSNTEKQRIVNMKTFDVEGRKDVIILAVNTCQLADDLLSAFDLFLEKIEKPSHFRMVVYNA
ncbi:MAG TPA: hypothetical protein VKP65_17400 [Rhodothermales bacterium]|nr:hypothetical protein [Rhodothermales bacterium]